MVEIGPGLGADPPLLKRLNHLHGGNRRDIIARLENDYPQKIPLTPFSRDRRKAEIDHPCRNALEFDFATLSPAAYRRQPAVQHLLAAAVPLRPYAERKDSISLQNEVVERMVAEPSTPAYGRLSVMLQYRFYMEKLIDVPPQSFRPAPKVDSAIVRMIPIPADKITVQDEALFAKVVMAAFGQRRKTLRNTLKSYLAESDFAQLGIDAQLRAENLGVTEFASITKLLSGRI
jgi:16S rRNA (adenine1518-N6/adenine1519-N6)-dimethyltransferase